MKLTEIQDLIKFVSKSGVNEVELETKEIKIVIKTGKQVVYQSAPAQTIAAPAQMIASPLANNVPVSETVTTATTAAATEAATEAKYITIKSPMIGTFYRSSGPDKGSFVNVGDDIEVGKPVCIIEAMKLFNEIESEIKGKIIKVLVDDSTPVEYDQPLFLVDPS
ncbi:MAG: acetyl-CoA carboxylase biotin carboxyl carrier protein [Burkholderiales bacterium]|nr:acetyl-CoA carboxylase biotin carboxyl carrier protein [Bacteroidia bacterium]